MGLEAMALGCVTTSLLGFGGAEVVLRGTIRLNVSLGQPPRRFTKELMFLVVDSALDYNVILGRPGLNAFRAVASTCHLRIKFPTPFGVGTLLGDRKQA